jgi:general L-amino acid transport system permease protein
VAAREPVLELAQHDPDDPVALRHLLGDQPRHGWAVFGIWDAGSLSECREIRDATLWRRNQRCLLGRPDRPLEPADFRLLPAELYWRPVLALILFLVAIAPVLFDELPRKMLCSRWLPFVCFWLIWGGTIWAPIAVAAGFVSPIGGPEVPAP